MNPLCPRCDSTNWVKGLRVIDRGDKHHRRDLHIALETKSNAILFKGAFEAPVQAEVCADCGYVSFRVAPHHAQKFSDIETATESIDEAQKKMGGFSSNLKQHPHYPEFIAEEPARKFLSKPQQLGAFGQWLKSKGYL